MYDNKNVQAYQSSLYLRNKDCSERMDFFLWKNLQFQASHKLHQLKYDENVLYNGDENFQVTKKYRKYLFL